MIRVQVDVDKMIETVRQDPRLAMLPVGVVRTMFVAGNIVFVWVQVDSHGKKNRLLELAAQQIHGLCHTLLEDYGLNEEDQDYAFTVVDKVLATEIEAADKAGKMQDATVPVTPLDPSKVN